MVNVKTLAAAVDILKENHIKCGIGGSYLLQLYHLCDEPNDVDFWVDPDDIQKVRNLFQEFEEIAEKIQLPPEYHYKIRYHDIEIDFVASFITRPNRNKYQYNIKPESIEIITTPEGLNLPCTSLEDWYVVYKLLHREKKAAIIENYIYKRDITKTNERLNMSIMDKENLLPKRVIKDVETLVWKNMQLNFKDLYKLYEE